MNRIANFVASLVVDCHIVLLPTMLLDLRHDFLFAIAAHLPITVLRTDIRTLKVDFSLVLLFLVRNLGFMLSSVRRLNRQGIVNESLIR